MNLHRVRASHLAHLEMPLTAPSLNKELIIFLWAERVKFGDIRRRILALQGSVNCLIQKKFVNE